MYEPIRTKSVHTVAAAPVPDVPRRSRKEELDIQLAGHLSALLAVVDEIRAVAPGPGIDTAAERLAAQVTRLTTATTPAQGRTGEDAGQEPSPQVADLHRRAHALAGRALVVAASRADTAAAILAAECMDAHTSGWESFPGL
jgi:hypothetical protein